jgi:DNA repair protein RecN (Recombination protein N)
MLHPLRDISTPLTKLTERMDSLIIEVEDWAAEANLLANNTEGDPARAEELESRINMLNKLLHKHRVTDMAGLLDIFKSLQDKLDTIANLDDQIEKLSLEIASMEAGVKELAARISEGRKAAAIPFIGDVEQGLALLGMDKTRLRIHIEPSDKYQASGGDQLSFEMAQGEKGKFATIRQAASGGETSRLALIIKSLVAAAIPLPTLVFDEIDAGVSGMVSMRMGDLLTRMARNHQLIVITHSPQIAARAQTHLMVSKEEQQGKVNSRVDVLGLPERIHAIAIMLSTDPPTPSAIANARELIG